MLLSGREFVSQPFISWQSELCNLSLQLTLDVANWSFWRILKILTFSAFLPIAWNVSYNCALVWPSLELSYHWSLLNRIFFFLWFLWLSWIFTCDTFLCESGDLSNEPRFLFKEETMGVCPNLKLFRSSFMLYLELEENCLISKTLGRICLHLSEILCHYWLSFQSRSQVFLRTCAVTDIQGDTALFKILSSLTLVAILNLAKIKINFARDKTTTELSTQGHTA